MSLRPGVIVQEAGPELSGGRLHPRLSSSSYHPDCESRAAVAGGWHGRGRFGGREGHGSRWCGVEGGPWQRTVCSGGKAVAGDGLWQGTNAAVLRFVSGVRRPATYSPSVGREQASKTLIASLEKNTQVCSLYCSFNSVGLKIVSINSWEKLSRGSFISTMWPLAGRKMRKNQSRLNKKICFIASQR